MTDATTDTTVADANASATTGPNGEAARSRLQRERDAARAEAQAAYERGRAEAKTEHARELLRYRLVAAGAGKLADPGDVPRFVDLDALADADDEQIAMAIDDLVAAKPYLAPSSPRFTGGADQRARANAPTGDPVDAWFRGKR